MWDSLNTLVINCPPILDLRAIGDAIDLVNLAKKIATVVLNALPPRGSLADEAIEAIAAYVWCGCCSVPIRVENQAAFVHSLTAGQTAIEYEPDDKAAERIQQIYRWICKQLKM